MTRQRSNQTVLRWSVRKRHGVWAIFDSRGQWHDTERTLPAAWDTAWRYATCDIVWGQGASDGLAV